MIKKIQLDFATLEFHEDIVVGVINEGVDLSLEQGEEIFHFCRQYYGDSPYALISHRVYSYSFNPFMHKQLANKQSNLKAFAVVAKTPVQRMNFAIEKMFFKIPSSYFSNLKDAMDWAKSHTRVDSSIQASRQSN